MATLSALILCLHSTLELCALKDSQLAVDAHSNACIGLVRQLTGPLRRHGAAQRRRDQDLDR